MVFGLITGVWNGVAESFGFNDIVTFSQAVVDNVVGQNVHGTKHDSNDWMNTVMHGLCPYSKTGTLFDDVLKPNRNLVDQLTVIKCVDDENSNFSVKMKYISHQPYNTNSDSNSDSLTLRIDSKRKLADLLRPYAQFCDEQTIGFKVEPENDVFSGDVGICQKSSDNHTTNVLYGMGQFKHPAAVVKAKCTLSLRNTDRSPPWSRTAKMEMSNVFGYTFKHVGLFAGCRWVLNSSRQVRWQNSWCPEIKCGLAFPAAVGQLTVKPKEEVYVLDGYWRVNDKLEVATTMKSNRKHLKWMSRDYILGMAYKHSDSITVNLKTDLNGNISTGLSLTEKSAKLGLYYESNVRNFFDSRKFGISLVF